MGCLAGLGQGTERFAKMKQMLFLLSVVALLMVGQGAIAQTDTLWTPPAPKKAERDWVQLTSGEWLWGDIEFFQDLDLTFDSEELDGLTIELGDIAVIRSARILTWTFTDRRVVTGTAAMQKGIVRVRDSSGNVHEFPSLDLLKIIEGDMSEINFWSMKASFTGMIG